MIANLKKQKSTQITDASKGRDNKDIFSKDLYDSTRVMNRDEINENSVVGDDDFRIEKRKNNTIFKSFSLI